MSAAGYGGYVKLHDSWMSDPALSGLMAEGRHDAVCLFFAAIAWSHAHDTDGTLPNEAQPVVERLANVSHTGANECWQLLIHRRLMLNRGRRGVQKVLHIRSYGKWQSTADQRKQHADKMRTWRSRDSGKEEERREEKKRDHVRGGVTSHDATTPVAPRRVFDVIADDEEFVRRASERIRKLEDGSG